jgi:uncharacterized membrane protein
LNLLPLVNQWHKKWFKITSNTLYLLANIFMMAVNLIDAGYYRFSFKRLTADITRYLGVGGDFNELIPQFLRDYWHIATVIICLLVVLFVVNSLINKKQKTHKEKFSLSLVLKRSIVLIIAIPLLILVQKGGSFSTPLGLMHASQYTTTQNTALVLNTPFTLYRTFGKPSLERKDIYSQRELDKIYSPITSFETHNWGDTLLLLRLK